MSLRFYSCFWLGLYCVHNTIRTYLLHCHNSKVLTYISYLLYFCFKDSNFITWPHIRSFRSNQIVSFMLFTLNNINGLIFLKYTNRVILRGFTNSFELWWRIVLGCGDDCYWESFDPYLTLKEVRLLSVDFVWMSIIWITTFQLEKQRIQSLFCTAEMDGE